jgi:hypothetical protein
MAKKAQSDVETKSQARSVPMIRVTTGYRGRLTNEQYIVPGVYTVDDPALFGLAQFLVDNGRAEVLPTVAMDEESVTFVTPEDEQLPADEIED